jgi:hypothetical protein
MATPGPSEPAGSWALNPDGPIQPSIRVETWAFFRDRKDRDSQLAAGGDAGVELAGAATEDLHVWLGATLGSGWFVRHSGHTHWDLRVGVAPALGVRYRF